MARVRVVAVTGFSGSEPREVRIAGTAARSGGKTRELEERRNEQGDQSASGLRDRGDARVR